MSFQHQALTTHKNGRHDFRTTFTDRRKGNGGAKDSESSVQYLLYGVFCLGIASKWRNDVCWKNSIDGDDHYSYTVRRRIHLSGNLNSLFVYSKAYHGCHRLFSFNRMSPDMKRKSEKMKDRWVWPFHFSGQMTS